METQTTEHEYHLSGDWTITGVVSQVDSLSNSLDKLSYAQNTRLFVDCTKIDCIDMSGLQLLHVWMQCANIRGVQAQLINLPEEMKEFIQRLGLNQCFTDNYLD